MPPATFMTRPKPTQIDTIQVDVALDQQHSGTNEVTDHPVERGVNISDHARPEPYTLTMNCVISNYPATQEQLARAIAAQAAIAGTDILNPFGSGDPTVVAMQPGYAEGQYQKLCDLKDAGALITVITSLKTYKNMEITALSAKRDAESSNGVEFAISFKQVQVVDNALTKVATSSDVRAKQKSHAGATTAQEDAVSSSAILKMQEGGAQAKAEGKGFWGTAAGAVGALLN